jgi:hypothetical protein
MSQRNLGASAEDLSESLHRAHFLMALVRAAVDMSTDPGQVARMRAAHREGRGGFCVGCHAMRPVKSPCVHQTVATLAQYIIRVLRDSYGDGQADGSPAAAALDCGGVFGPFPQDFDGVVEPVIWQATQSTG